MFYFVYIAFIIFISITIYQLINDKLMNEDLFFLICCNYLLNITTAIFFGYYSNLIFAFFSSLLLLIFATMLYYQIIKAFDKIKVFPIPYLFLVYFVFFFIFFNLI